MSVAYQGPRPKSLVAWLLGFCLVCPSAAVHGQEAPSNDAEKPGLRELAGVTGSVRMGYWSSTRDFDPERPLGAGMIWLKSSRQLSTRVSFLVEGWAAVRGPAGDADAVAELREAFLDLSVGPVDVRAGRQILAWGRADGINPTDNLTGEDLTLLTPDDDDRRRGTSALRMTYHVGGLSLTGLWLPEFRSHRFPLPLAPDVVAVHDPPQWPGDQWAARVERTGQSVDWSVSYFQGRDLTPDVGPDRSRPVQDRSTALSLSHHRVRVVGADLAANLGRIALRAEGAYVATDDASERDPFVKNPFLFIIVGGDRTFREYLNVNVQYLFRRLSASRVIPEELTDTEASIARLQAVLNQQVRRIQHGASFRVAHKWLRETLEGEVAAVGFLDPDGAALRPRLAYAISDRWKVVLGAELYRGESSSLFGLQRPNSTAYAEARWSF